MKATHPLIVLAVLAVTGGCAGSPSPTTAAGAPPAAVTAQPAGTEQPAGTAPTAGTPEPTGTTRAVPARTEGWSTAPVTVRRQPPVPPVPVVTGIRYAAHRDGFDRVVLDVPGALPGYTARYVTELHRDGSGEPVSIPGEAFLLIVLNPAQAHRDDGTATVTGIHRTGLAGIKSYAVIGDYEGYVSIALGLSGVRKYHVGELTGRIYVDVAV